ncbi:uncharacterized protein KY384_002998 [Bacidia gigantensis]|uniref:uncharacterized protein n=1 Tax=Bacidia gigantensis TaxID=2732470 RepID=UPI001D04D814|nr:uncharacterized protein KY384_002998 [Bacidia gigantensis]KAG8531369.1 hypothetical protein KY384_002998 [Bacidia gigantensis]
MQTNPSLKLAQEEIDLKPWKYTGYQSLSRFLASDNDFFILRRFGTLTVRVLLRLQDQLVQLEERLAVIEHKLHRKEAPDVHNGTFREDTQLERTQVIDEAQGLLKEYRAPKKDIRSLENWLYNNDSAINRPETEFITFESDLFSVVPTIKSPLRKFLEISRHFRLLKIWKQRPSDCPARVPEDENVHYTSDKRMESFIAALNLALGVTMLIAPLWILAFLENLVQKLGVIFAFIVLFLTTVSFVTVANTYESLAATAA